MRTPHGDADVSIVAAPDATTLGDVVAAVTGQAVPRLVQVDDRVVDAATPLDHAGLLVGSVVTSEPVTTPATSEADVELVQIAGHGAGRTNRLGPGRYRIGPGRRVTADELTLAPVEQTMFELVVEPTAASSEVTVVVGRTGGTPGAVSIDSVPVDGQARWPHGTLSVAGRAFQLDSPARSDRSRSIPAPDSDGTVGFSRPPRRRPSAPRRPVADAVHDAVTASPTLWERRPGQPDAFVLPIGVHDDSTNDVATVDLATDHAVAVAGSEGFRSALARTLMIETATLHGPADVDLVVLTDPDRLAQWDWAKWLPHLRLGGMPTIWGTTGDIERWADDAAGSAEPTAGPSSRLTVVVVDDPTLWSRRESPLRSIVSNVPDSLRLIALCDDIEHAPAICTTIVSESASGLARLESAGRSDDSRSLYPALTEAGIALQVARGLAPFADVELPPAPTSESSSDAIERIDAAALIGIDGPHDIEARWADDSPGRAVTIGRRGGDAIELAVSDQVTAVLGASVGDAFDVAAGWLLGLAADRSPDELWIAPIVRPGNDRSSWWWQLPHATDQHDDDVDATRFLARLRSVLAAPDGPRRIVVVTETTIASPTPDIDWLRELGDGVHSTNGLALVVITDRPEVAALADALVTVVSTQGRTAVGGSTHRREAVITTPGGAPTAPFAPLQRSALAEVALVLEPFVVGRASTPLERRIERTRAMNSPDPALDRAVGLLLDAASHRPARAATRTVVPPPLVTTVDLEELFATSPGDGVPLGLLDEPATAESSVFWWEPGSGSMLVFGSRRSGIDQVLTTLLLGVVDRFSDLDVSLVVVEASAARRQALSGIDRSIRVVDGDDADEIADALDEIEAELSRQGTGGADGPRTVVLIDDLVRLRERLVDLPLGPRFDDVLARAAAGSGGVDVVAWTSELAGAGPFAASATRRLVGASSNHDELRALDVERPGELDGITGRCRAFPHGGLVQLATADTSVEELLGRRAIGEQT